MNAAQTKNSILRNENDLTEKQKAIQRTLFKDKGVNGNQFFTINIFAPYTTNDGRKAYLRTGSKDSAYTEDALMTAIYTGKYQQGLIHFISCKRKVKAI